MCPCLCRCLISPAQGQGQLISTRPAALRMLTDWPPDLGLRPHGVQGGSLGMPSISPALGMISRLRQATCSPERLPRGPGCQHQEGRPVPTRPGLCWEPHPEFGAAALPPLVEERPLLLDPLPRRPRLCSLGGHIPAADPSIWRDRCHPQTWGRLSGSSDGVIPGGRI